MFRLRFSVAIKFLFVILIFCTLMVSCAGAPSVSSVTPRSSEGTYAWPPPPAPARIKWVQQWSNKYDFGKPSQVMEFLIGTERVEALRRPNGVVVDASGNIYVAESEIRIIFVFDRNKNTLRFLGMGRLGGPIGLAIDNKRGILYVSDARLKKVFAINKDSDSVLMTIGSPAEFKRPAGMVFDDERERLYVADSQDHVVKVFDKDGRSLFTIGRRGTADGEFNYPSYLALDRNGRLYVVDSFNFRVQIFDPDGNFIKKFGKLGDASGYFSRPAGIGVDSDGHIYVVDTAFNNFQIFNEQGRLMLWVGHSGSRSGEFYLPSGMYIDKDDNIYVSDTFNRRLQVFKYLKE